MISRDDLIAEYRAISPCVKASLAVVAVSMVFMGGYHVGEPIGVAASYFFNR